jgi:hypothetical protein
MGSVIGIVVLFLLVSQPQMRMSAAKGFLLLIGLTIALVTAPIGAILLAPIYAPTAFLKWIVIPLGMARVAYWTVRLCLPFGCLSENAACGVIYGALALARRGALRDAIAWLEHRMPRTPPMAGAWVVAAGLLAALRGEGSRARYLLAIADGLPKHLISRRVRTIARDWLVVDAARIGAWRTVIRLGRRGLHSLRWSYCMARIGERLAGDPAAGGDWLLWSCFLMAPRRRATYSLLRRALAAPVRRPDASAAAADLPHALADLAQAIGQRHAGDSALLARSVCCVDSALDAVHAQVQERLRELGGRGDANAVLSAFRHSLSNVLAVLVEDAPQLALAAERGPLLDQVVSRLRAGLFRDIAARCKDYNEREAAGRSLDAASEWEAWAALRSSADRLLELDPGSETALFQAAYVPVCNFATQQHNKQRRVALAHVMYAWLLQHCHADPEALKLLGRNVRLGRERPR